jgi:phosphoribosylaminoimidazole-succinocarboxamide synthase
MNSLDTLGYCKRLEAVGVPREHAEVHAQILTEVMSQVATKDDLKEQEVRMKEWVALYVREQVAELKADLVKWLFAVSVAQASLIIAALRYLPH